MKVDVSPKLDSAAQCLAQRHLGSDGVDARGSNSRPVSDGRRRRCHVWLSWCRRCSAPWSERGLSALLKDPCTGIKPVVKRFPNCGPGPSAGSSQNTRFYILDKWQNVFHHIFNADKLLRSNKVWTHQIIWSWADAVRTHRRPDIWRSTLRTHQSSSPDQCCCSYWPFGQI